MSNDRLLVAVNSLIGEYEKQTTKNISLINESNLDILQYSNLHKSEMFLHSFEIGNNLSMLENIKADQELKTNSEPNEYIQTVSPEYSDCASVIDTDKVINEISSDLNDLNSEVKKPRPYKEYENHYKFAGDKLDEFNKAYNELFNDLFKDAKKAGFDIEGCTNCKKPMSGEMKWPAFEIGWELKQFLSNLRKLLNDINVSLDSTKLAGDLCNFYKLLKENKLCISSWPLVAAAFPILITKARSQLMELGFNWTSIIGPIVSPILNGITYTAEMLKNMVDPIFDCLINAFKTMRLGLESVDMQISSLANQATSVGNVANRFVNLDLKAAKDQIEYAEMNKKKLKAIVVETNIQQAPAVKNTNKGLPVITNTFVEELSEQSPAENIPADEENETKLNYSSKIQSYPFSQDIDPTRFKIESSKEFVGPPLYTNTSLVPEDTGGILPPLKTYEYRSDSIKLDFKEYKSELNAGGRVKTSDLYLFGDNKKIPANLGVYAASTKMSDKDFRVLQGMTTFMKIHIEGNLIKAKNVVDEIFNKMIYTFKSFSRLIMEPLYTSSQLITEIKIAFNLIKLIRTLIDLIDKRGTFCDSLNDANSKSLLNDVLKDIFDDIDVEFDNDSTENTTAIIKSKTSNYQSRLVPNDCGDVLVKVNDKQASLDLLYDKIVNELG